MPDINKKVLKLMQSEMLFREFSIDTRAINEAERTVDLAFSSEEPVDRCFGDEILDHKASSVRMDRLHDGAALLLGHDHRDQIGVVRNASIDKDRVGRASVLFSRSAHAQEIFQDVVDGIRSKISVGYRIHTAVLEEQSAEKDIYRITDWEPFEISFVSVPADATVGVGRSAEQAVIDAADKDARPESAAAGDKAGAMPEQNSKREEVVMPGANNKPAAPADQNIDLDYARKEGGKAALQADRQRVADIEAIAERAEKQLGHDAVAKLVREARQTDTSVDEFRQSIYDAVIAKSSEQRSPIGLNDKEAGSFSFLRLMSAMADPSNAALREAAAYEFEVCQATAQRMGRKAKGALIPTDVLSRAVTTTGAASTIATDTLSSSFIDLLRNKMRVRQLGATVLGGLAGNISIPRQSGGATAAWVAEGAQPAQSNQTFDAVTLAPNGVAAETQVTTQTLIQSSIDMEAMIRNDLASVMALAIDLGCINGSGAGGQPTGILNTAGIGSVALGANGAALANVDPLIDLEAALANVNADEGNMAYLTNSHVIAALKKLKTTTGEYLWTNEAAGDYPSATLGSINGYSVARSNQVPSNLSKGTSVSVLSALIFGNWSDLIIGEWGALDLQVDPYTGGIGNVKVKALQFVDCAVRHPESFAAITDIV